MVRSLSFIAFTSALVCSAQEQAGLFNSNYAGTDAVGLNPARMAEQWQWLDVNILGADAFLWNDHVYATTRQYTMFGEVRETVRTGNGDRFDFAESIKGGQRHAFNAVRFKGPAFSLSMGRSAIGVSVASRGYTSLTGLSPDMARFIYNGLGYAPQHGIQYNEKNVRMVTAAWTEIGASYARILYAGGYQLISVGGTAKYLLGHGAAGIGLDQLDYTVVDTARVEVYEASGSYGFAEPAINAGRGLGLDLGFTFTRTIDDAGGYVPHQSWGGCEPIAYRYRLGVSLVDLGGLRFRNAVAGTFENASTNILDYDDIQIDDAADVDSLIAASMSISSTDRMRVGLPTALAVQYDQRVIDRVYVAVNLTQNMAVFPSLRMRRTNTFAVAPRFETKRFEAAIPIVLHEYDLTRPSVGFMLRFNNIIIGSDNALPLVSHGNIYGADLYFRIKWTVFRGPVCRGKAMAEARAGDGSSLPCIIPKE